MKELSSLIKKVVNVIKAFRFVQHPNLAQSYCFFCKGCLSMWNLQIFLSTFLRNIFFAGACLNFRFFYIPYGHSKKDCGEDYFLIFDWFEVWRENEQCKWKVAWVDCKSDLGSYHLMNIRTYQRRFCRITETALSQKGLVPVPHS